MDKNGTVPSGTVLDVGVEPTFWVEGVAPGIALGEQIRLVWTDMVAGPQVVDKVNSTVYKVDGPMNVPGYSEHLYTIQTPDARSTTISVRSGGTNSTVTSDPNTNITSRRIRWGEGVVVGIYRATPITGEPFFSDREVNVVKVVLDFAGADNKFKYDSKDVHQAQDKRVVDSALDDPAVECQIKATSIEGPSVGTSRRGARFIEVGILQLNRDVKKHSDFNDARVRRVSSIEDGPFLLDTADPVHKPWYYQDTGYIRGSDAAQVPLPQGGTLIKITDAPIVAATDVLAHPYINSAFPFAWVDQVDSFSIVTTFKTYVVVHTLEIGNDANRQYTIRAEGRWSFNASGPISQDGAFNWSSDPAVWLFDNNPLTGNSSTKFTEVSDGRIVPVAIVEGKSANEAVSTQTWKSVPM